MKTMKGLEREMPQLLATHNALAEDPSSLPNTHLQPPITSVPENPVTAPDFHRHCLHKHKPALRHIVQRLEKEFKR